MTLEDQPAAPRGGRAVAPVAYVVAAACLLLGWLVKLPCAVPDPVASTGGRLGAAACYNDATLLYDARGLGSAAFPYRPGSYMEYPVVTGVWIWLVARAANVVETVVGAGPVVTFFTLGALALTACYLWAVRSTGLLSWRRPRDVMIMCASPLLVVHAFTNWDLLPIALTAAALLAWARRRPALAGVLLGLGAAAKLYPVALLAPLLVLCLRAGVVRTWWRAALAAAATLLAVNLPIAVPYTHGWLDFVRLNSARPPEWNSWYYLAGAITGRSVPAVNLVSVALLAVAVAAIAWLGLGAARRPRLAQLAFLVVAAFLLTSKVWSPQYSLWLLPLVVLALPRWRPVLVWQSAEVVVWVLLTPRLGPGVTSDVPLAPFVAAAVVRDATVVLLVVLVVRDVLRPEHDAVRADGVDDPVGGVLDGAPDRVVVPPHRAARARAPAAVGSGEAGAGEAGPGEAAVRATPD